MSLGKFRTRDAEIEPFFLLLLWAVALTAPWFPRDKFPKQNEIGNEQLCVFRNRNAIKLVGDYTKDFIASVHKGNREYYTDNPFLFGLYLSTKAMHVCLRI